MKINLTCHLLAIISFMLVCCKTKQTYPELEASKTDSLRETAIPGVFISGNRSVQVNPERPDADTLNRCHRNCAGGVIYWCQVSYPITVCYPPDFILEDVDEVMMKNKKQDSVVSILKRKMPVTNMTGRSISRFNNLFCSTRGGPWIAEIKDVEQCSGGCGEGPHRISVQIIGVGEFLYWEWIGSIDNPPAGVPDISGRWVRGEYTVDCDASDHTNCTGNTGETGGGDGGGGHIPLTNSPKKVQRK